MSLRHVLHVVGLLLIFVSFAMVISGGVSLIYGDGDTVGIFVSAVITLVAGILTNRLTSIKGDIRPREGFAIVTFAWGATAIFGALPYILTGTLTDPIPAIFESMSGFTTTGATVFSDIESLPHGVLFWRSFTQWLGGMGIIVLAIAILPYLGVGGMQLFKAEVPGPTPERLRPRITQTAKLLWYVYLGMSVLETVLLMLGGMSLFDAVNHTFTTGNGQQSHIRVAHKLLGSFNCGFCDGTDQVLRSTCLNDGFVHELHHMIRASSGARVGVEDHRVARRYHSYGVAYDG